jgi:hypothetical protein
MVINARNPSRRDTYVAFPQMSKHHKFEGIKCLELHNFAEYTGIIGELDETLKDGRKTMLP